MKPVEHSSPNSPLPAEAVRSGRLTPPALPGAGEPPAPEPVARLGVLLDELDADRRER